ncbi:MAG: GNAT family N-acetyltransferase [Gemmatimonadales bacterium]
MTIPRLATPADAPVLTRLINTAYRVEAFFINGERIAEPEVRARIEASNSDFLVTPGVSGGGLTGAVYVELRGDCGYFGLLSVDPDVQGTGLGRTLVEAAEAHCRAAGCRMLEIDIVNLRTELPSFYAKWGFTPVGVTPFPAPGKLKQPVHMVQMRKSLD